MGVHPEGWYEEVGGRGVQDLGTRVHSWWKMKFLRDIYFDAVVNFNTYE